MFFSFSSQSIFKLLFNSKSFKEMGTIYQLKVMLNRRNVTFSDGKIKNFNACDDFMKIIVSSHFVAVAMELLHMNSLDDEPSNSSLVPEDDWTNDPDIRTDTLYAVSSKIVKTFVDIRSDFTPETTDWDNDKVLEYSRLLLSVGLIYLEYCDAIKEGDGMRVLRCWRFLFLIFRCTGRVNYTIESCTLLAQYHFLFSKRQAHQLIWSRFVNTQGLPGRNIPCDLYMEHLNRVLKEAVAGPGANKTPNALVRVGKVIEIIDCVAKSFDEEHSLGEHSGKHKVVNFDKDMTSVIKILMEKKYFDFVMADTIPPFRWR